MTALLNSLTAVIPFLLLFLPSEKTADFFRPCEKDTAVRFRGFFALTVILHHMAQRVQEPGAMMLYYNIGFVCVAVFFFYSGYGFMKKGISRKTGFLRKRLPAILLPYVITMALYWVIYTFRGEPKDLLSLLMETFDNRSGISFLWYVYVYTGWILTLSLALKFIKQDRQIIHTGAVFAVSFIVLCLVFLPRFFWIYDTVLLIPFGCIWAYHETRISDMIHRHYRSVLTGSAVLFVLFSLLRLHPLLRVPAYMTDAVLFVIFLNTAAMKRRPSGKALFFLGSISYEMYLLHGIPVTFLPGIIQNDALWTIAVLLCTIPAAYMMKKLAGAVLHR